MKLFTGLALLVSSTAFADHYANFEELSARETEDVDFQVTAIHRNHPVGVFAVHGGRIEKGTSELARAIARDQFNLYLFEGLKRQDNGTLHLTSENFGEPRALELARQSAACVSVHGFNEAERELIYVGGGSPQLRDRFLARALSEDLPIEIEAAPRFKGESPRNIVNRCRAPGLQLELSSRLRARLLQDKALQARLAELVQKSVQ